MEVMYVSDQIGVPSEETIKLETYLTHKKDGEDVTYKEILENLAIDLRSAKGRGYFYTACRRLGRECVNIQGYGYRLSSIQNAPVILDGRANRVRGAATRAITATDNLLTCHAKEMPKPQVESFELFKHANNAILGKARSSKKLIRKEHVQIPETVPVHEGLGQ